MNLGQFETRDTKGAWIHGLIIGQVPVLLEIQKVVASSQNCPVHHEILGLQFRKVRFMVPSHFRTPTPKVLRFTTRARGSRNSV